MYSVCVYTKTHKYPIYIYISEITSGISYTLSTERSIKEQTEDYLKISA